MLSMKKTRTILVSGFFSMIVLILTIGVSSISVIENLTGLNKSIYNHPFVVMNNLLVIKLDISEMRREIMKIPFAVNSDEVDSIVARIDRREAQSYNYFDVITDRFLGDKAMVNAARRTFADWKPLRAEVIELVRAKRFREAEAKIIGGNAEYFALLTERLDAMIAFADGKAAGFRAESDAKRDQNRQILFWLVGFAVLAGGMVFGFVFFKIERTAGELANAEAQLRQAQKLEAVGQLTGGLAHDLNNVLAVISMNTELLNRKVTDIPRVSKHVDAILKGVNRAASLTRRMLDFSRTEPGRTERVSANAFVQGMESLIAKSLTPAITLKSELAKDAWLVDIDPGDLEDALLNLALNARDAMPNGGALVIETANKVIDRNYVNLNPGSTAGEFVMISVSDTGTGMTPDVSEKAFEPFFTTKEVGKGTGLGLSMVYGFVRRSGGHVKIYSEVGEGTSIHLYLPRAYEGTEGKASQSLEQTNLIGGDETVLVVDDEEDLVDAAVSILESLGYRTITASSGKEAIEILRQDPSIDLLFTDVIMPGNMDGYRLAFAAIKDRPDLKVLLTSGFTRKREEFVNGERQIAADLTSSLLHKPYNVGELAMAVRGALDRQG